MIAAVIALPESLPKERRSREPLRAEFMKYTHLARDGRVMGFAVASGFYYAGIYAYIAGTPFAYIDYYKVPADQYGLLFGLAIAGQMAMNVLNRRYVVRLGSERLLRLGAAGILVSGLWAGVAAWTGVGGLFGLVAPLCLFMASNGLFIANAVAGAMEVHPERAGAISAFVGAFQFGSGMVGTALVGAFANGTPRAMGALIAIFSAGCFVTIKFMSRAPLPEPRDGTTLTMKATS